MIRSITGIGEGKGPIIVRVPILYTWVCALTFLFRASTMVSRPQALGTASLPVAIVWHSTPILTLPSAERVIPHWPLLSLNHAIHGRRTSTQLSRCLVSTLLANSLLPLTTVGCLSMVYRTNTRYVSSALTAPLLIGLGISDYELRSVGQLAGLGPNYEGQLEGILANQHGVFAELVLLDMEDCQVVSDQHC